MALAAGGSIVDAIRSMAFAFVSMNVWTGVGDFLHPIVQAGGLAGQAISTVTHAVVGGALSVAQGGSFLEGFASGGLGDVGSFAGFDIIGTGRDVYARCAPGGMMVTLRSDRLPKQRRTSVEIDREATRLRGPHSLRRETGRCVSSLLSALKQWRGRRAASAALKLRGDPRVVERIEDLRKRALQSHAAVAALAADLSH